MNIKIFLVLFISVFVIFVLAAVIGNILESTGMLTKEAIGPRGMSAVKIISFILFCIMGFSIVPLAVRFFVYMQVKIGNEGLFLVKFIEAHEQAVVLGAWGFLLVGLSIAMAAGFRDGFFK